MKKLGVCGDSFYAAISHNENDLDNGAGKHFTEILSKKLGWDEPITFARGGCSNSAIRLQIDEIIKHKPDFVIVGTTSVDRYEFSLKDLSVNEYYEKHNSENDLKIYNNKNGIFNIDYFDYPDKSAEHDGFKTIEPTMISDTLSNLFFNNQSGVKKLSKNDITIVEQWFDRFYDYSWKEQIDTWIISDGLRKLKENNINFLCVTTYLSNKDLHFMSDNIVNKESILNPVNYYDKNIDVKYRFHTTLESQEILANLWYDKIIEEYGK